MPPIKLENGRLGLSSLEANQIKEVLSIKGITQGSLAKKAQISPGGLSHIITGERSSSPETLDKIFRALGSDPRIEFCSIDTYMGEDNVDSVYNGEMERIRDIYSSLHTNSSRLGFIGGLANYSESYVKRH